MRPAVLLVSLSIAAAAVSGQRYNPRPAFRSAGPFIPIVSDRRTGPLNGAYDFAFETGNGIRRNERGTPSGPRGTVVSRGDWSFTFPDGSPARFNFVADENGYRVDSPLLPVAPPMPAHSRLQVERARQQPFGGRSSSGRSFSGSRRRFGHSYY